MVHGCYTYGMTCAEGGLLVGPRRAIEDRAWGRGLAAHGCPRLRCRLCGNPVLHRDGWRESPESETRMAELLAEFDSLESSALARPDPDSRLYACGCSCVGISGDAATPMPGGVWTCEGHLP